MDVILLLLAGLVWGSSADGVIWQGPQKTQQAQQSQQAKTAQEPEAQRKPPLASDHCAALVGAEETALAEEDWASLQTLAQERVARCKGVQDGESFSSAYYHLAVANIEQKRSRQALPLLDTCIQLHYLNCYCHVERVNALVQLSRLTEARTEARLARLLIPQQRALLQRQLPVMGTSLSYSEQALADRVRLAVADLDVIDEFLDSLERSLGLR